MEAILVANTGSSSFKFQVFATDGAKELLRVVKGQIDGIGTRPHLRAEEAERKPLVDFSYPLSDFADLSTAIQVTAAWLRESQKQSCHQWRER